MPSKKNNCYCPNCKGALRDSKTLKRHAAKAAELKFAHEAQKEEYEHAKLGGDGSDLESDVGMSIDFERDVDMDSESEGRKKRRRMDNEPENMVSLRL